VACTLAVVAAVTLACDKSTPAQPSSAAAAPVTVGATPDPCAVTTGGPAGPVTDPSGPFFHSVAVARTADGVHLTGAHSVLDHASVPDGVLGPGGDTFVYYVNGAAGYVWAGRTDGSSLTPIGPISLNGNASPAGVVDPDATRLPGGRIRLAYLGGFGAPNSASARAMCLADSDDGVAFTVVGPAYDIPAGDTLTDPSLARLTDGSWLMAMSRGQQTVMARSGDGLRFGVYDTLTYGGVPEVATLADGRVRLYVCGGGIVSYLSSDSGRSWTREDTVVAPGTLGARIICDPSWVPDAGLFIFKIAQ
jgi:hypothetical protein